MGSSARKLARAQERILEKREKKFFRNRGDIHKVESDLMIVRCKACEVDFKDHREYRYCLFGPDSEEFVFDKDSYWKMNAGPKVEMTAAAAQQLMVRYRAWKYGTFDASERERLEKIARKHGFKIELT